MVKPRFPGHVEAPSATRRATDKWAHDTMRPEQLDSGSTHTSQPQEGCALLHPLQGVSLLSTPLQGGILKPPALRVVVDLPTPPNQGLDQLQPDGRRLRSYRQRLFEEPNGVAKVAGLEGGC